MTLEEFLKSIEPTVTLSSVLVALAIGSLWFWRYLWNYEQELRSDHIAKLRDLLLNFRDRHIDPLLKRRLIECSHGACDRVMNNLRLAVYEEKIVANVRGLHLRDSPHLSEVLSVASLESRLATEQEEATNHVEELIVGPGGDKLFQELDHAYDRRSRLTRHYRAACAWSFYASNACLILGLLLMAGTLQVLTQWRDVLWYSWFFGACEAFVVAVACFIMLEYHRRQLLFDWEELQLYGAIE